VDLVSTTINAAVVATVGLVLAWLGKGRFAAMERRFGAQDRRIDRVEETLGSRIDRFEETLGSRIDRFEETLGSRIYRFQEKLGSRIDRVEETLGSRIDRVEASLDGMRSDLTQVALAVGARRRATNA
jgi:hypothetical protein